MNVRLLQRLWQLRRLNCLSRNFTFSAENYATLSSLGGDRLQAIVYNNNNLITQSAGRNPLQFQSQPIRTFAIAKAQPRRTNTKRDNPLGVDELIQTIESQWKEFGNVRPDRMDALLVQLESQPDSFNQLLTEEHTIALLEICGSYIPAQTPTQRLELFNRLWAYLARNEQLTAAHYATRLQALQYNRIGLEDVQAFLDETAKRGGVAGAPLDDPNLYADLLEVACGVGNMRQATTVLEAMRARNLPLTERNFNALIVGHGRNGDAAGWRSVVENMQATAMPSSARTHAALVLAHADAGQFAEAMQFLRRHTGEFDALQVIGMLRAVTVFAAEGADSAAGKELVAQLVRELPEECKGGPELPLGLRTICIELVYVGKIDALCMILDALPTPRFAENQDTDTYCAFILRELTYASVTPNDVLDIAQLLRTSGKNTRALYIAAEKALRRYPPSALPIFAAIDKAAISEGEGVQSSVLRPHFFWPLFQYNFRRHGEAGLLQTLRTMTSQFGVVIDTDTLRQYVLPRLSLTMEDAGQAVRQLDEAGVRPSVTLTPILNHMIVQQKLDDSLALLRQYPTRIPVTELIGPLTHLAVHVRATRRYHPFVKLLVALKEHSETARIDLAGQVLIDVLTTQERFRSDVAAVKRLVSEFERCGVQLSGAAIQTVKGLVRQQAALPSPTATAAEDWEAVLKTLATLRSQELSLASDGVVPAVMMENMAGSAPADATPASSFLKHPRDMSFEELECHLVELESKRMNVRGVLRRLLQICVRDGRLQRALEVKAKCEELKVQSSPGMMASIFDLHIKLKDLEGAKQAMQQLASSFPGFQIDEHKMIDYATLLVQSGGQLDEALTVLSERAGKARIQGGDYVLKNIWNFLNAVAHHAAEQLPSSSGALDEPNITREAFEKLVKLGYCRPFNAVLGPIVREWLLRGDLEAAVAEFCRLAAQYRHTPLQFEMLSLLVRNSNNATTPEGGQPPPSSATDDGAATLSNPKVSPETAQRLLTDMTAAISRVHGALNMNSALLLAFAESGTDGQLRRLLIDPVFRINQALLVRNCEHLGRSGAVSTLLRLGRCSRGVGHVVDEQKVYTMLLDQFVAANACDAAMELFERLEADDELKISQDFLRSLVKLLRMNNREIPSRIALRAQVV